MAEVELSDETSAILRDIGEQAARVSRLICAETGLTITTSCNFAATVIGDRLRQEMEAAIRARSFGFDYLHFAMAVDALVRGGRR